MASWICPFCEAAMTVKPQLVGLVRPCPKCGQESIVADAADPAPAALPPRQSRLGTRPAVDASTAVTLGNVESDTLTSVLLAQCLLVLILIGSGLLLLFSFNGDEGAGAARAYGLMGIVSVVVSWPIYSIANESYRSRKLLEEILKKSRQ